MSKKQNVDSGKKEEEIMLFEIKAPGWSFAYAGLFQIEEVAEEICIELEHDPYVYGTFEDVLERVDERYPPIEIGCYVYYPSDILARTGDIDKFVCDEIWNNIYYTIQQTLENMKEEEEKTIYEFEIKCIEE